MEDSNYQSFGRMDVVLEGGNGRGESTLLMSGIHRCPSSTMTSFDYNSILKEYLL
jgi:hypothetical protein